MVLVPSSMMGAKVCNLTGVSADVGMPLPSRLRHAVLYHLHFDDQLRSCRKATGEHSSSMQGGHHRISFYALKEDDNE